MYYSIKYFLKFIVLQDVPAPENPQLSQDVKDGIIGDIKCSFDWLAVSKHLKHDCAKTSRA